MMSRGIRLLPIVAALGLIVFRFDIRTHKFVIGFLIFILLSGAAAFFYEKAIFREFTLIFAFIGYILLGFTVIRNLNRLKSGWLLGIYFCATVLLMAYFLYELTEMSRSEYVNHLNYLLLNLSNLGLVFILASALLFVHQNPNKISMLFLGFAIVFILSELMRGASYYYDSRVDLFFYGCRILFVLALAMLVYCCGLVDAAHKNKVPRSEVIED